MVGIEELRQALYGFGGVFCYTHYFIHNIFLFSKIRKILYTKLYTTTNKKIEVR